MLSSKNIKTNALTTTDSIGPVEINAITAGWKFANFPNRNIAYAFGECVNYKK